MKVDSREQQERLGSVQKAPRWAIAYKFEPLAGRTKLKDIWVNVGRTGALTPQSILEPVNVGGVTISRATLHNEDYVREKGVLIGDTVVVERAGDVIPQVVRPVPEDRDGSEHAFEMPAECPVCGEPVSRPEGEAVTRCINTRCPAQALEHIIHWCTKGAMDIDGLGEKLATRLFDLGLIKDVAGIYELKAEQLVPLEGFGEKSAENLIRAIEKSKEQPFPRVLYALGIRHVGVVTAGLIAEKFSGGDLLEGVSVEVLTEIDGIGEVVARAVVEYFDLEDNRKLVRRLMKLGLNFGSGRVQVRRRTARREAGRYNRHPQRVAELLRREGRSRWRNLHLLRQQEHRLRARRGGGRLQAGESPRTRCLGSG